VTRANYLSSDDGRREPTEITDLLGAILERVGTGAGMKAARLIEEWPRVGGDLWSGRSLPIGIRSGTLLVEVPTGAEASLLKFDIPALIGRIEERFGAGLVTGVRFRVSSPRNRERPL
jgi:hypothetical protein